MTDPRTLQNFVDGQFVTPGGTELLDVVNPVDGEVVARSPISTAADVDAAMVAAQRAFKPWSRLTPSARQRALLKLADAVEAHAEELVESQHRNTGQPRGTIASDEVATGADQLRFFAGAARLLEGKSAGEYFEGTTSYVRREPIGVVGQVTPWNFPFLMAVWKIGPALAMGNTVVLKPSDTTPESTLVLAEISRGILPDGVFNVVLGNAGTGAAIVDHPTPGLVSITGSVRAGIAVATGAAAGLKRSHLELGGKAPAVVFDDVDVAATAEAIADASFYNAGQDCTAITRVLVHERIHDELVEKLTAAAVARTTGPVEDAYFGPVITVQSFDSEEEALELANGVRYALASSVWTADHKRAMRVSRDLDFGAVWINTHILLTAEMPHGGFKHSGYGKDLSMYGVEDYTRIKHVMSALD